MSHGGPGAPLVLTASAWCGIVEVLVVLVALVVLVVPVVPFVLVALVVLVVLVVQVAPVVLVVLGAPVQALNITFCCPLTLYWGH